MFLDKIIQLYLKQISNIFTLTGNIDDIVIRKENDKYIEKSIFEILVEKFEEKNHLLIYSPSKGIRFSKKESKEEFLSYDEHIRTIHKKVFDLNYADSKYNIVSGLHHIKSILNSYKELQDYSQIKVKNLVIIIEDSDIVFPSKEIASMSVDEKIAISLAREMFNNSNFIGGDNIVIMSCKTSSSINNSIRNIPTLNNILVDMPTLDERLNYIEYINSKYKKRLSVSFRKNIATISAGISLVNLKSILKEDKQDIQNNIINEVASIISTSMNGKVKVFIPKYDFNSVIGYEKLKSTLLKLKKRMFLEKSLVWRGMVLIGPSGVGKDFILNAFLSEIGIPAIKLGNLKSKWYGETLQIVENLRLLANSFDKLIIYKTEADTMFSNPQSQDNHQTDKELMGEFLDWMGDNKDRGKIFWVFNTSRPQMLPTDFERRVELKIPIFDLEGEEKWDFTKKMFELVNINLNKEDKKDIFEFLNNLSNDNIRALASEVASEKKMNEGNYNLKEIIENLNFAVVTSQREKQSQEAALKSTYNNLVPQKYK